MITLFCVTERQYASLFQNGLDTKVEKSRKQMKERKNRAKKIRGVKKVINFIATNYCHVFMIAYIVFSHCLIKL